MTYSRKQMALLVAAFILLVAVVAVPSALTLGGPFGPRETLQPLSADNVVQPLLYKNPNNNKYFLRMAVQKPKRNTGFILSAHDEHFKSPGIKSIDVIVKGKTAKGQTVVSGLKDIKPLRRRGASPWREYFVPDTMLISTVPDQNDFFLNFEWISFDLELDFPVSGTWREQYDFVVILAAQLRMDSLNQEQIDRNALWNEDPALIESIGKVIGPPPPRKR